MSGFLIRTGLTVVAFALAVLLMDEFYLKLDQDVYPLVQKGAMGGGALVLAGFVFGILGKGVQAIRPRGAHCTRCGMKVTGGSVYCKKHLDEAAEEYRAENLTRKRGPHDRQ